MHAICMKLSEDEVRKEISNLDGWKSEGDIITKKYRLKDFREAMKLATEIGELAEQHAHHPDLEISYGSLVVKLTTHDEGGITNKDIELARAIEAL